MTAERQLRNKLGGEAAVHTRLSRSAGFDPRKTLDIA